MAIRRRPRKFPRKRVGRKTRGTKVGAAVRSYVKKALHKQIENKVYTLYGANQTIVTAAATTPTAIALLPLTTQGTAHGQRIAQEIRLMKGVIRGYVNLLPYSATLNPLSTPIYVKMWVVSSKLTNAYPISATGIATSFFEAGTATVGFSGNMIDMCLSNNKDAFTIHATKTLSLGASYPSSTGPVGTGGYYDNSKMSLPFSFSYAKHFKSVLKYNDDTSQLNSNLPFNKNCWLVFQCVNADGSSSAINSAEFHYTIRCEYEDA